jgi:predicted XRE-type DNA-binding protein
MKDIPGYKGKYAVDEEGNVYSLNHRRSGKCKLMSLKPNDSGHLRVKLYNGDGTYKTLFVHRLVLLTFVGECPEGMEGCHNDGDPTNNRLDNLRWDTKKSNLKDCITHGNYKGFSKANTPKNTRLTLDQVEEIRKLLAEKTLNQRQIAQMFDICQQHVSDINNGRKLERFKEVL